MAKLYNLARMTTATVGTGTITLGSAVSGCLTFALAGAANGDVVSYGIKDGANSEVGTAPYTSAGTLLGPRTVTKSTNANAAISLSGTAEVFITPRAEDFSLLVGAVRVQKFTASGTYTPDASLLYAVITCYGGGAGGGGAATTSTGFTSGGGGGAGSKSIKTVSAATVGVSQTVTIGAAGTAGTAGANNGGAGGDTSVGALCIGKGASGGAGAALNSGGLGGAGGVAGTGDVTGTGAPGSTGVGAAIQTVGAYSNAGGSTDIGGGAPAPVQTTGIAATGPGGGGSGGSTFAAAVAGGAGFRGEVHIVEYCAR